jgi:AraC-like DNA-binding protein
VLPTGERQLHPISGIASFTDQHMLVEMNGPVHMFCLRLKPGVLFQLSGVSQIETANVVLQTNEVFSRGGREYSDKMQESTSFKDRIELSSQFVLQQLARQKEEKKMIRQIAATILDKKGRVTVGELTDEFPLSERHLQREFKLQIGSSPKSFARMARFNHAFQIIKSSEKVDWQNVVFECGYFDQGHFIREFAAFTGKSPASFLAKREANLTFWETMTGKVA